MVVALSIRNAAGVRRRFESTMQLTTTVVLMKQSRLLALVRNTQTLLLYSLIHTFTKNLSKFDNIEMIITVFHDKAFAIKC